MGMTSIGHDRLVDAGGRNANADLAAPDMGPAPLPTVNTFPAGPCFSCHAALINSLDSGERLLSSFSNRPDKLFRGDPWERIVGIARIEFTATRARKPV